ncbi:MAG: hypothetical protein EBX37_18460 [Alphaproteobacteria bacterium]|nr:hypothetical protein [Alphaproteobacteria bacterium]
MLYLYSSESRIGAVLSFPSIGRLDTSVFEIRENGTVVVFLREGSFTVMLDVTAGPGNGAIVPYVNDEPFPGAVLAFALSEPVNPFSRIFQKYFFSGDRLSFHFIGTGGLLSVDVLLADGTSIPSTSAALTVLGDPEEEEDGGCPSWCPA